LAAIYAHRLSKKMQDPSQSYIELIHCCQVQFSASSDWIDADLFIHVPPTAS